MTKSHTITITFTDKALKDVVKELYAEGYEVKDPVKLVELLFQKIANQLSYFIMEDCLDGGGNNLLGDTLTDAEAQACGATSSDEDDE